MHTETNMLSTQAVLRAEAKAIHGADAVPGAAEGKPLYRALNALGSVALCLSGGGIRSAAFGLGVIQALAVHPRSRNGERVGGPEASLLNKFHYLSTVSGGGYIGSWLSVWIKRLGFVEVWPKLVAVRVRPEDEPAEIAWLRRYSNYLTPKLGLTSVDSWAAVAISLRNLLLNWLIILPIVCLGLLVLKLIVVGLAWLGKYPPTYPSSGVIVGVLAGLAALCVGFSLFYTTRHRPTHGRGRTNQPQVSCET